MEIVYVFEYCPYQLFCIHFSVVAIVIDVTKSDIESNIYFQFFPLNSSSIKPCIRTQMHRRFGLKNGQSNCCIRGMRENKYKRINIDIYTYISRLFDILEKAHWSNSMQLRKTSAENITENQIQNNFSDVKRKDKLLKDVMKAVSRSELIL